MFPALHEPDGRLSYHFLLLGYAAFALLGTLLFILEKVIQHDELVGKGYYVMFTPFLPCVCWAAYMSHKAARLKRKEE